MLGTCRAGWLSKAALVRKLIMLVSDVEEVVHGAAPSNNAVFLLYFLNNPAGGREGGKLAFWLPACGVKPG